MATNIEDTRELYAAWAHDDADGEKTDQDSADADTADADLLWADLLDADLGGDDQYGAEQSEAEQDYGKMKKRQRSWRGKKGPLSSLANWGKTE